MNSLFAVVLAVVVAVQAKPNYGGLGIGSGLRGLGGGYGSGKSFGNSEFGAGQNGMSNQDFGNHILNNEHNIGHQENDFDSAVHHHQSADHNIGGLMQGSNVGHNMEGYGGYNQGHNAFGNNWQNGLY